MGYSQRRPGGRCVLTVSLSFKELLEIQSSAVDLNKSVSQLVRDACHDYIERINEALDIVAAMKGEENNGTEKE